MPSQATNLKELSDDELHRLAEQVVELGKTDRQEMQIEYYEPASETAKLIHTSKAKVVAAGGGNRSSKTESVLAEFVGLCTGVFPKSLYDEFRRKFRGPINCRVDLVSLKTVLYPVMLPKLKWWVWSGDDEPGGDRGHWGWVPKMCLKDESWDKAWSEKEHRLSLLCRNPDNYDEIMGESIIQFTSHDVQEDTLASGTFHNILHDEAPPFAHWREHEARVMEVGGRLFLAMTWPDDPAIAVDWIYDMVYEPGKDPNNPLVDWIELQTVENKFLNQKNVADQAAVWDEQTKAVRLRGQPIRFSSRIHPEFTDLDCHWSFPAGKAVIPIDGKCPETGSDELALYNHVAEFDVMPSWPCVFLLDPHPRKPHMFSWVVVDPNDDLWQVMEGECEGDPTDVYKMASQIEHDMQLSTVLRIMDPNMGAAPASITRGITWQHEFESAGLRLDLADDSAVGRARLNQYLKPDRTTLKPRIHINPRCPTTILQMKRYAWDDYKRSVEKDQKQLPKAKYDDFPTLLKYLMNTNPTFAMLQQGAPIITRVGKRHGAY